MGLAGRADTTKSYYRCYCEEDSFRSSKKKHSCNDIRYRYNNDGSTSTVRVSNLSSAKAAILMADELRSHVKQTNLGIDAKNRLRDKILERVPAQVEYVLREREEFVQMPCVTAKVHYHNYDFDRAA